MLVLTPVTESAAAARKQINSVARKARQAKGPSPSFHLQKVLPTVRMERPPSIKAIRSVLRVRLPTQGSLICGELTLKVARITKHSSLVTPNRLSVSKYIKLI